MSDTANTAAEERFEEDLLALRSYIETEEGRRDTTNAGVLGRLLLHAHTRLDVVEEELRKTADVLGRIGNSLEQVVAPKLHELRQLPEEVAELRETLPLYAALRDRIAIIEADLQGGNLPRLPEGVKRELGSRDSQPETARDLERENEVLARKCSLCVADLQLADTFADTGRPSRLRCTNRACDTLYRIVYDEDGWPLQFTE